MLFGDAGNVEAFIMSYEDSDLAQQYAAQLIFGSFPANGKLPVNASEYFPLGIGFSTKTTNNFKYTIPLESGLINDTLEIIDSIVFDGIDKQAFPGCQIFIAKNNKVVFNKTYGYHTYKNKEKVKVTDMYDLASITKVAASTLALMKLYEDSLIHVDSTLECYLPGLDSTNKEDIIIREMMAHQARLKDWIPFYSQTMKKGEYLPGYYSANMSSDYPVQVAKDLYMIPNYRDSILLKIAESKLRSKSKYKYSDLGYYYLQKIIDSVSGTTLDTFVYNKFYKPMGLASVCYLPLNKHSMKDVVPTEMDTYFRKQNIHGYVHDPGAAMIGGVAGHAGLFANTNDLARLMQMLLQKGQYNGVRYINEATIDEFTKPQFPTNENRRGIGFDKPQKAIGKGGGPTCNAASVNTFGHTGFTGTAVWVDPDHQLIYVFLSNRVYPDGENYKLIKMNIRTNIQKLIYNSIIK